MKVERGEKRGSGSAPASSRSAPRDGVDAAGGASFQETIERVQAASSPADAESLFREIEAQAAVLTKKRTVTELNIYRDLVTSFLKSVVEQGIKMSEVPSAHFLINNKVFVVAGQVNEKLLALAERIHTDCADAQSVVAATSEIRGLLMDLRV